MMEIILSAYLEMNKKNLKNFDFVVYPPALLCAQDRLFNRRERGGHREKRVFFGHRGHRGHREKNYQ
jgi:hypothetical protein